MMMAFNNDEERNEALADLATATQKKARTVILAIDDDLVSIKEAIAAFNRERVLKHGGAV